MKLGHYQEIVAGNHFGLARSLVAGEDGIGEIAPQDASVVRALAGHSHRSGLAQSHTVTPVASVQHDRAVLRLNPTARVASAAL